MNIQRRRTAGRVIAALSAVVGLVGCSTTGTNSPSGSPSDGATVDRLRTAGGPWGYPSPFAYSKGPGLVHDLFLFDTLLWKDSTGKAIPWLAASWQRSPDAKEWRITLRDGIKWHDGQLLTADDVVFTLDYVTKGPGRAAPGLVRLPEIAEAVADGPTGVVIRLTRPFAPFEVLLGRLPIIPRHVWADVSDPAKFQGAAAVMGSGPYKLDAYDPATNSYGTTPTLTTSWARLRCNTWSSCPPQTSCWRFSAASSTQPPWASRSVLCPTPSSRRSRIRGSGP